MTARLLALTGILLAPLTAAVAQLPCSPCAAVRGGDPGRLAQQLRTAPGGEGAPVLAAWSVEAREAASVGPQVFTTLRATGAIPWPTLVFSSSAPIADHLDQLEAELVAVTALAGDAGDGAVFQISWQTEARPEPVEYAYLVKRAAVALVGARPGATVVAGPLPLSVAWLEEFLAADVTAYVDGFVLTPAPIASLTRAAAVIRRSAPGRAVAIDALPLPGDSREALVSLAEHFAIGIAATFFDVEERDAAELAPLKIIATELSGDVSLVANTSTAGSGVTTSSTVTGRSWSFVRAEDLGLRVVVEFRQETEITFLDPQHSRARRINLHTGQTEPVETRRDSERQLVVRLEERPGVGLLQVERGFSDKETVTEALTVGERRQPSVEEILRRLQSFEDQQARRLEHYRAIRTLHLRYRFGLGNRILEVSYRGELFFRQGHGSDWAWEEFELAGVRWRRKKLPPLPLIQPEKVAALPLVIELSSLYSYVLQGEETVDGRRCWVVSFEPTAASRSASTAAAEPGSGSFHRGTVWIDQELYARVRSRVRQLGLAGEVLSNDETNSFQAVDQYGRPAAWTRDSFVLPVHTVGQQLLSVINKTTQLELEAELTEIRINGDDFAHRLSAAHASDVVMVRDTRKGFLPLVKDDTGRRVVDEGEATSRIFIVAGLSIDDARDFPVPLAGINYLSFDFLGSGAQFSVFFAGALADIDLSWPRFAGSRWNLGGRLEVTALARTDERFRNGEEIPGEELERRRQRFEITAGRPFGSYTKLDLTYRLEHATFDDKESTSEEFLLPRDVLTETFTTDLSYLRSGYRAGARWAASRRDRWQRWGLPTDTEFSPDHREYNRWRLSLAKSWWLPLLTKFGVELQHQGGSDLDRFSKFGFSSLGDSQTQAERSSSVRVVYGFDLGDFVRLEAGGRAAWVVDRQAGLDNALVAGFNINGTVPGPIGTLMNIELRAPVETPGAARHVSARIIFLKLLGGR